MNTIQLHEKRTEEILLSLDKLSFLSRSQIQQLHDLKSDRNACRVLKNMGQYLNRVKLIEYVYYLNKSGREMIGSQNVLDKNMHIEHTLMRNQLYIHFGCPEMWSVEKKAFVKDTFYLQSDVLFKTDVWRFAEIDHMQKMIENEKKIKKYAELKETNAFQNVHKYFPQLVFLTTTEHRKRRLIQMCRNYNMANLVLTLDDIK